MAHLPLLQKGTEADQVQEARLDQHSDNLLVPTLSFALEHFGDIQRLADLLLIKGQVVNVNGLDKSD